MCPAARWRRHQRAAGYAALSIAASSAHKRIDHAQPAQDGSGLKVLGVEHCRTRLPRGVNDQGVPN